VKSILIIDTPKNCLDCQLMVDGWCYAVKADRTQEVISAKDRTCWCPLRPLPQKKNTDFHPNVVYANGWNDCLKEIEE